MFEWLGRAAKGLGVLALAAGLAQGVHAAPVISNSGNTSFYIIDAAYLFGIGDIDDIQVIPVGPDSFRVISTAGPLVPTGDDLSLVIKVLALNSTTISTWASQIVDTTEGFMGETVSDYDEIVGLGTINVTAANPSGQISFSPQGGLTIIKDINGTDSSIGYIIQGLNPYLVPEPASMALLVAGVSGLVVMRRRRKANA